MKGLRRRRRLGCFRLPRVKGARSVVEAKRGDVSWLARTDVDAREVEFSKHWNALPRSEQKRYIVEHEKAHLLSSEKHDAAFYTELRRLVEKSGIPWKTAWELEVANLPQGPRRCRG